MPRSYRTPILALAALAGIAVAADDPETRRALRWRHTSTFAWQAQLDLPTKDLGQALDNRSGLGLGAQWTHDRGNGKAARTRLEWNLFPEGHPVGLGAVKTKASNYILSFDRLYHFAGETKGAYVLAGLGGVRWFTDRTAGANPTQSGHVTKLAVTAGAGYRFTPSFSAEARYLISTLNQSLDGNMMQAGLNFRF
jgi:opacity protein-like surface antigen